MKVWLTTPESDKYSYFTKIRYDEIEDFLCRLQRLGVYEGGVTYTEFSTRIVMDDESAFLEVCCQ